MSSSCPSFVDAAECLTNADDRWEGAQNAESKLGLGGNDTMNGKGGDDDLWGGDGNDYLDGGLGNDTLIGDFGDDTLDGSLGDDILRGGTGQNTYILSKGNDSISGHILFSGEPALDPRKDKFVIPHPHGYNYGLVKKKNHGNNVYQINLFEDVNNNSRVVGQTTILLANDFDVQGEALEELIEKAIEIDHGPQKLIIVNTNQDEIEDNNTTSLREALIQTQVEPGNYSIVFDEPTSSDSSNSGLGIGYWTIELKLPLPAIRRGKVRINTPTSYGGEVIKSKNVTLVPNLISPNTSSEDRGLDGPVQMSLMTIGDPDKFVVQGNLATSHFMYQPNKGHISTWKELPNNQPSIINNSYTRHDRFGGWPEVTIHNFNFIKHKARGGDGGSIRNEDGDLVGGGGGGLGTGAGLSIVGGDVYLKNSLFQDLSVEGGEGAVAAPVGEKGSRGGWLGGPVIEDLLFPGITLPTDVPDQEFFINSGSSPQYNLFGMGGHGAAGGEVGETKVITNKIDETKGKFKTVVGPMKVPPFKFIDDIDWSRHQISNSNDWEGVILEVKGSIGKSGSHATAGGFGAGGGRGGHAGPNSITAKIECSTTTPSLWDQIFNGKRPVRNCEEFGSYYEKNANGSRIVKNATKGMNGRGGLFANTNSKNGNWTYGHGAALGAGISVLNHNSNLLLESVNFVGNSSSVNGQLTPDWNDWSMYVRAGMLFKSWPASVSDIFNAGTVYFDDVNLFDTINSTPIPLKTQTTANKKFCANLNCKPKPGQIIDDGSEGRQISVRGFDHTGKNWLIDNTGKRNAFMSILPTDSVAKRWGIPGGFRPLVEGLDRLEIDQAELKTFNGNPIHHATSFITKESNAKIVPHKITNSDGIFDINIIDFETGQKKTLDITLDSTAITEGLNEAYRRILPDKSDEILAQYESAKASVWQESGLGFLQGFGASAGNTISDANVRSAMMATKSYNAVSQVASGLGVGLVLNLASSAYGVWQGLKDAKTKRDSQLKENEVQMEELRKLTSRDRSIKASPINIEDNRSIVQIKNFKIGEDTVILQGFDKGNNRLVFENDGKGAVRGVLSPRDLDNNSSKTFLRIHVDDSTEQQLSQFAISLAGVFNSLLYESNNNSGEMIIGKFDIANKNDGGKRIQFSPTARTWGPASTHVATDRERVTQDPLTTIYTITTLSGHDLIEGSPGKENITAGPGMDKIRPGAGEDTVNGGPNFDTVDYRKVSDLEQADLGALIVESDPDDPKKLIVKSKSGSKKSVNDRLINIESIHLSDDSRIDFSLLPKPNREDGITFYEAYSGAGSTFEGSNHNDIINISFQQENNLSSGDAELFEKTSFIDGGGGTDELIIDLGKHYNDQSNNLEIKHVELEDNTTAMILLDKDKKIFAVAKNIEKLSLEGISHIKDNVVSIKDLDDDLQESKDNPIKPADLDQKIPTEPTIVLDDQITESDPQEFVETFETLPLIQIKSKADLDHQPSKMSYALYRIEEQTENSNFSANNLFEFFAESPVKWKLLKPKQLRRSNIKDEVTRSYLSYENLFEIVEGKGRSDTLKIKLNFDPDFENPIDERDDGIYGVRVQAKSKKPKISSTFDLFVRIEDKSEISNDLKERNWESILRSSKFETNLEPTILEFDNDKQENIPTIQDEILEIPGSLEHVQEIQYHPVHLKENQVVGIGFSGNGLIDQHEDETKNNTQLWGIYNSKGELIELKDEEFKASHSISDLVIPKSDIYRIGVTNTDNQIGSYELVIVSESSSKIPEDDFSGDKSTNSVINLFNASTNPDEASSTESLIRASKAANIETAGDVDWHAIDLIKGSKIAINTIADNAISDDKSENQLSLLDDVYTSSGLRLLAKEGETFEVPHTDTYYISIQSLDDFQGDYLIEVVGSEPNLEFEKDVVNTFSEGQRIIGLDPNSAKPLEAITRGDTLIGSSGDDILIGAESDDPFSVTDGKVLITSIFDGEGNDFIEPKDGFNDIVIGSGRNTIKLPETSESNADITSNLITFTNGKDKVINYSSDRDILIFDGIEKLSISQFSAKKKVISAGNNIYVKGNNIFYLNDGDNRFNKVKFIDPINFDPLSLQNRENSTLLESQLTRFNLF